MTFASAGFRLAAVVLFAAFGAAARADDVAVGSVRLRGGFDANPTLLPGGRGSAFTGIEGAFAAGREQGGMRSGVVGEIERTEYAVRTLSASERARLDLKAESTAHGDWSLRSSTSLETTRTATLRSFDAIQRGRVEWTGGPARPFLAAQAQYSTLNETNALFLDFLPNDQRFGRLSATPGAAVKSGGLEWGGSVRVSVTRYGERLDAFGFRRDNERAEPFAFMRYEGQGLTLEGSVSRLYGRWHDVDFSAVRQTLYDVTLSKSMGAWTLDLGAKRYAGETTFPISPISLSRSEFAKLTWKPNDVWTFGVLGRSVHTAYLDSPFSSDTAVYGVTASYALAKDVLASAELLKVKAIALNGEPADGGIVSVSLTRRFARDEDAAPGGLAPPKQWAADRPPIAVAPPAGSSPSR